MSQPQNISQTTEDLLLSVRNLQVTFRGDEGLFHAVKNITNSHSETFGMFYPIACRLEAL